MFPNFLWMQHCPHAHFFYKQQLLATLGWNSQKNQANAKQHPETELFKIIHILHQCYQPRIIGHILKNKQKDKFVCIHKIMAVIIMKNYHKNEKKIT